MEKAVSGGVPLNITHLFSAKQFSSAAEAYLKGVEKRIMAGLKPITGSVASLDISRWEAEGMGNGSDDLSNPLGVAIFRRTYKRWQALLHSPRWERAYLGGAQPLRLQCIIQALQQLCHHEDVNHVWANTVCISGALLGYNMFSVIRRQLDKGTLMRIFFSPILEETKGNHPKDTK